MVDLSSVAFLAIAGVAAGGSCVSACVAFIDLRATQRVHAEVRTTNGITAGLLAERQEGRRIEADVPHAERTTSEQGYVDRLEEGGR